MPPGLKKFGQSWIINTLAVLVAVYIVKGIHYEKWLDLLVASLVLGILNWAFRRIIMILTLPLLILTLGLFIFVINALLLYFVGYILRPHFYVDDFWSAFWGALIISFVTLILNTMTGSGDSRIRIERQKRSSGSDKDDDGPVIDV